MIATVVSFVGWGTIAAMALAGAWGVYDLFRLK